MNQITKPKNVVAMMKGVVADSDEGMPYNDEIAGLYFKMQTNRASAALCLSECELDDWTINQLIELTLDTTEVKFDHDQMVNFLKLFPETRAVIYSGGLHSDSESQFLNALSLFFVGSAWPQYGDDLDIAGMEVFIKAIKYVAEKIGYTTSDQ